jgi:hypothetical protein
VIWTFWLSAEMDAVRATGSCVLATTNSTVPAPCPSTEVSVSQEASLWTDHRQSRPVVTLSWPRPPSASNVVAVVLSWAEHLSVDPGPVTSRELERQPDTEKVSATCARSAAPSRGKRDGLGTGLIAANANRSRRDRHFFKNRTSAKTYLVMS